MSPTLPPRRSGTPARRSNKPRLTKQQKFARVLVGAGLAGALIGSTVAKVRSVVRTNRTAKAEAENARQREAQKPRHYGVLDYKAKLGRAASKGMGDSLVDLSVRIYDGAFVPDEVRSIYDFCNNNSIEPVDFFWAAEHPSADARYNRPVLQFLKEHSWIANKIKATPGSLSKIEDERQLAYMKRRP